MIQAKGGAMKRKVLGLLVGIMVSGSIGCSIVKPRLLRPNWEWDGVLRVMPNSIFEPVARAKEAAGESLKDVSVPASSMHEELSLDGAWRYKPDPDERGEQERWFFPEFDDSSWKTMPVPNNYMIDDPSLRVFFKPVWFRRSFELPASVSGKRLRLVFESVDYFARVWLNGKLLGEHEGYFNPFMFDITDKVKPGRNVLVVKVTNPWDMGMDVAEKYTTTSSAEKVWVKSVLAYHDSRPGTDSDSALDSQSYGTGGICRPVKIVATGEVAIDWTLISPRLFDDYTRAEVTFEVFLTNFSKAPKGSVITVAASGENFAGYSDMIAARTTLLPGPNKVSLVLNIDKPRLWWPWSHPNLGQPDLYRARITVAVKDRATDQMSQVFGVREVRLTETGPEAFFWFVNGKRISFRGTNGFPTEYYSKITPEYLGAYFNKLKDNNMDILIVHDHQAPPVVYDVADREGVVILQNFTLIWEVNVCDFIRPNGAPALTSNPEVIGRMATEAIWYLYNHPSIFWWSMHDESAHIGLSGHGLMHGNFCRPEPYQPGEEFPVYHDPSLNLDLDNQLIRIARAANPIIPMHRTGGLETDSVTWYGWSRTDYFDLLHDPEQFPLEFGGEAVSYSMAKAMSYYDGWFPIEDERSEYEWKYHGLQMRYQLYNTGRTTGYETFNDWAFASQLHQAVVIKYHIEINRENKYDPTGSVLQYMLNDWWPSANFGVTDWNLEDKIGLAWMKQVFTPQLVATRVGRNIYSQGERIELPLHLMNDQHLDFPGAKVSWRLVEETDSFIMKGYNDRRGLISFSNFTDPAAGLRTAFMEPITVTIGHQVPVATVLEGLTVVNLAPDSHLVAAIVQFETPRTREIKHYTLYMTLTAADGETLSENWDHFIVVPNARRFNSEEGITPAPRFDLELSLKKSGAPLCRAKVIITDKYNPDNQYRARLDEKGRAALNSLLPGAYRITAGSESYEFLVNRNEKLEVDFRPGLKTTLGTSPIIKWREEMGRPCPIADSER
jgi:beta-mannosidase